MASHARHRQRGLFVKVVSADQVVVNRRVHFRFGDVFSSNAAAILHNRFVRSSGHAGPGYENENANEEGNVIFHFAFP
jgi:hypothetical protein